MSLFKSEILPEALTLGVVLIAEDMSFINPLVFNRFNSAFCKFVTDSVSSVTGQNRSW